MLEVISTTDLAFVLLSCWVKVGNHCCGVGHQNRVHHATGHHADHDNPHFYIIWRAKQNSSFVMKNSPACNRKRDIPSYLLEHPSSRRREQSFGRGLGILPRSTLQWLLNSGRKGILDNYASTAIPKKATLLKPVTAPFSKEAQKTSMPIISFLRKIQLILLVKACWPKS